MTRRIDQFQDELRSTLSEIAVNFDRLSGSVFYRESDDQLRDHLLTTEENARHNRKALTSKLGRFNGRTDREESVTRGQLDQWKSERQSSRLHLHADRSEQLALAAVEIVALAIEQADRTILYALLARHEAISAQIGRSSDP